MTRFGIILFCAVALSCGYPSEPETDGSCTPLKGKVVGTHVRCAGLVIQVTDGPVEPSQVQESFTDYQGNTFTNTFRLIGMCELPEQDSLWLADTNNAGKEFSFYIDASPTKEDTCYYCYTYVMFPDVAHRIVISHGECYDTPE